MEAGGPSGGTDPGSAREEAERLVVAALAMARSAASEARDRAGAFGPFGQAISEVLDQVVHPTPTAAEPSTAEPTTAGPAAEPTAKPAAGPTTAGPTATPAAEQPAGPAAGFATGGPECCVCPVCRSIAALRDPNPEFAERLATGAGDFAAGVASLLRAFATATTTPGARPSADRPDPADDTVWREATRTRHDSWPAEEPDVWAAATRAEAGGRDSGPDLASGRPPVPGSRTPERPVAAGPGEQVAPDQGA